jgi:hypothetical protein
MGALNGRVPSVKKTSIFGAGITSGITGRLTEVRDAPKHRVMIAKRLIDASPEAGLILDGFGRVKQVAPRNWTAPDW